jgi:peptidylprolyl isomerase
MNRKLLGLVLACVALVALVGGLFAARSFRSRELLSALPRGTAAMGFYEKPEQHVSIKSIRVASDLPEAERTRIQVMRTDTATFQALIEARRNRRESWFKVPAGHVEIANVPVPVR